MSLHSIATADDDVSEPSWQELYVVVRPEEKVAVERALQCVVPPMYTTMSATGRGREGGLANAPRRRRFWFFGRDRAPAILRPKIVFYVVLPEEAVEDALQAIRAVLRSERGTETSLGAAFVLPMGQVVPITSAPRRRVGSAGGSAETSRGAA